MKTYSTSCITFAAICCTLLLLAPQLAAADDGGWISGRATFYDDNKQVSLMGGSRDGRCEHADEVA